MKNLGQLDGKRVFFTSDTHFCHANIIKYCSRPFVDVEQMNETLIANWNRVVGEDDIVFHLGDFVYGGTAMTTSVFNRLNGTIHLVLGNHDLQNMRSIEACDFASVEYEMLINVDGQYILLNHYPMLCYAGADGKVWQLFGHVHSGPNAAGVDIPRLKALTRYQYDVGVDNNNYAPVPFTKLRAMFNR